uniref:SIS domain-containing protein n=1 Tax=Kalanchoe fedtschenkoi TaxID=63787 RepID=A0A7N0UHI0_KALFE
MAEEVVSMCSLASQICNQIAAVFSSSDALDAILTALADAAKNHRRIFVHGVGRELLMLKSLCMRLVHLGLSAHVVGDVTTPPIRPHDLLIASAGPGSFSTVDAICAVARANSAIVLLVTAHPETPSCKNLATHIAYLPARTMADDHTSSSSSGEDELISKRELLPMGSLYEGAMFVLFEVVVYKLGDILGEAPAAITLRHTNLE